VNLLRNIYFALYQSKIQYGIICWGGTYDCYITPILIKQKCLVRLMLNKSRLHLSLELFHQLKILPLKHLFYFCTLKVFFRRCGYWQVRFCENYNLRRNNLRLAEIPSHNVNHFLNSFLSIAPRLYNKIPRDLLNSTTYTKLLIGMKVWLCRFNYDEIDNLIKIVS